MATNREVREIARAHRVDFVYLAEGFIAGHGPRRPGLDAVPDQPEAFELVWKTESAALYRVRWENLPAS